MVENLVENLKVPKTLGKDTNEVKNFIIKTRELNALSRDNIFEAFEIFSRLCERNMKIVGIQTDALGFVQEKYYQFLNEYTETIRVETLKILTASFEYLCAQVEKLTNDQVDLVEDMMRTTDRLIPVTLGIPNNSRDRALEGSDEFIA